MICHACNRQITKPSAVVGALTFGPECAKRMGLIEPRSRAAGLANQDRTTMDMFEEKRMLSCDKDPEKYRTLYWVQAGWSWDGVKRTAVMKEIRTDWQLKRCGAMGKDRVKQCEGCQHA